MTSQGASHGTDHGAGLGARGRFGRSRPGGGARRRTLGLVSALALAFGLVGTGAGPALASPAAENTASSISPTSPATSVSGTQPEAVELQELRDPSAAADRSAASEPSESVAARTTANDAGIRLGTESASVWDMERVGMDVFGWRFTPGQQVTVYLNDTAVGQVPVNGAGEVGFNFTAQMPPGQHRIRLVHGEDSVQATLTVVADDQWYTEDHDPYIYTDGRVFTQAQLAASPPEFLVYDLPARAPVDILVNGERVQTQITNSVGKAEFTLTAPRAPGTYVMRFDHPAGGITATAVVVPNSHGAAPAAGRYGGSSLQTHYGRGEADDPRTRAFSLDLSADGKITGVSGEYFWVCIGPVDGSLLGSGTNDFSDFPIPATRITAGRPFEITWHDGDFTLYGTVHANGTASGDIRFDHGACGQSVLDWSVDRGAPPAPVTFPDIPEDAWFYAPVNWMVGHRMTQGYSDGTFRPYRDVTRAEAVTFLYRYTTPDFTPPATARFPDVPVGHNHFDSVSWATATGVVKGYEDDTFKPTRTMTRGEVALILYRRANPGHTPPATSPFNDTRRGDAYYDAVTWLYEQEITVGLDGGGFGVRENVTRGQIATFLHRYDAVVNP